MQRRFMWVRIFAMVVIVGLLASANTGKAAIVPNASFTEGEDGLSGWTKGSFSSGSASVIKEPLAPHGGFSVRLITPPSYSYLLWSSSFSMNEEDTLSGWFYLESPVDDSDTGLQVALYSYVSWMNDWYPVHNKLKITQSHSVWEHWSLGSPGAQTYRLVLSAYNNVDLSGPTIGRLAIVPIPGALWLLASGLAGLALYRRKVKGAKGN